MANPRTVTKQDIYRAIGETGVKDGDMVLIHSSLSRFGHVIGGASSVIQAAKDAVTDKGTVVMPTLVQRDFANAYRDWDIEKTASDVGHITETFRTMDDTVRSDQATHSVAAWGKRAVELTCEHSRYGPRMGVFGDYCFSYSSPWQKMYCSRARVVMMGIDTVYNTFKHFVEYAYMERLLQRVRDPCVRCAAMSHIAVFGKPGIWPFHDSHKTQCVMESEGMIRKAQCGDSTFLGFCSTDYADLAMRLFVMRPGDFFDDAFMDWYERYELSKTKGDSDHVY